MKFKYTNTIEVTDKESFYSEWGGVIIDHKVVEGKDHYLVALNGVNGPMSNHVWFTEKQLKEKKVEPPKTQSTPAKAK